MTSEVMNLNRFGRGWWTRTTVVSTERPPFLYWSFIPPPRNDLIRRAPTSDWKWPRMDTVTVTGHNFGKCCKSADSALLKEGETERDGLLDKGRGIKVPSFSYFLNLSCLSTSLLLFRNCFLFLLGRSVLLIEACTFVGDAAFSRTEKWPLDCPLSLHLQLRSPLARSLATASRLTLF